MCVWNLLDVSSAEADEIFSDFIGDLILQDWMVCIGCSPFVPVDTVIPTYATVLLYQDYSHSYHKVHVTEHD